MTSAQPHRTSSYSDELRWRMVYQCYGLEFSYRQIAKNLNVDVSTVCRVSQRFEQTGDVCKKKHPQGHDHHMKGLTPIDEFLILELVADKPGIYLRELQAGFTHRKLTRIAGQRCDFLRSQFMEDLSIFSIDMLVFVDESGSDNRDALRKYGYSLRGQPAKALSLSQEGNTSQQLQLCAVMVFLGARLMKEGSIQRLFKHSRTWNWHLSYFHLMEPILGVLWSWTMPPFIMHTRLWNPLKT